MRDVTDNRTGELAVGEVKRGRGRPRKPGALSNAERQAAYRARRRTEYVSPMHRPVVDPEALLDVADLEDDMAELRAELDATKAELAEAHETIDEMQRRICELLSERAGRGNKYAKTVTGTGNGNPVSFDLMIDTLVQLRRARKTLEQGAIFSKGPLKDSAALGLTVEQHSRLWDAICPSSKCVTPKRVTKKGA